MIYIALGGAFGSFSDKMEAEVGPAFISYNQSTTRFEVSKPLGALASEQRIRSPQISLGPEWAHGRQIDNTLPDRRPSEPDVCIIWYLSARSQHVTSRKGEATESLLAGGCHYSAACSIPRMSSSESPK
jgi:hypothetical protein